MGLSVLIDRSEPKGNPVDRGRASQTRRSGVRSILVLNSAQIVFMPVQMVSKSSTRAGPRVTLSSAMRCKPLPENINLKQAGFQVEDFIPNYPGNRGWTGPLVRLGASNCRSRGEATLRYRVSRKRLRILCHVLPLMLAAGAVQKTTKRSEPGARISEAATAPLVDLNLIRTKIPEVLNETQKNPYLPPADRSCSGLAAEILLLDDALGPDLDVQKPSSKPGLVDQGSVEAGDWAMGALKGAAEGLLPYRSWVRKLTGAERHSREVTAAVAAGIVRRAYLKGIGQILGCQSPAAPLEQAPPNDPL